MNLEHFLFDYSATRNLHYLREKFVMGLLHLLFIFRFVFALLLMKLFVIWFRFVFICEYAITVFITSRSALNPKQPTKTQKTLDTNTEI